MTPAVAPRLRPAQNPGLLTLAVRPVGGGVVWRAGVGAGGREACPWGTHWVQLSPWCCANSRSPGSVGVLPGVLRPPPVRLSCQGVATASLDGGWELCGENRSR